MRKTVLSIVTIGLLCGGITLSYQGAPVQIQTADARDWTSRTITACDRRKTVIVEGARPDVPLAPAKAQQVASLLQDLMRFCTEEIQARLTTQEEIFLSVNGLPYQRYVIGQDLPLVLVHGKPHSQREMQIWAAEYKKMIDEGNKLFHDSTLGKNGISCDMCHPNASNTHPETYPKFQTQLKSMALLRDMINWCLENPLEGAKLADNDPKMKAIEAYILDQRKGIALEAGKH
jgi:thiosulfate dehydrogenase